MSDKGACLALLLCIGCWAGGGSTSEKALIEHGRWEAVAPEVDPCFEDAVGAEVCGVGDYAVEGAGDAAYFEVDTTDCNYLTVSQPSLARIEVGDTLQWTWWHLPLSAQEYGEAVIELRIAERTIFTRSIAIPAEEAVYSPTIIADFSIPAGSPVFFNLHNHGANSWRFHSFTVAP
ncbi:MAG: hypothetical protein VX699_11865 [Myxococcota bacterium]|nr:hypothetical protein [Myxococcota bacterium]